MTGERPLQRDQQLSSVLWRGRYLILAALLASVLVAEYLNLRATRVYEATAVMQAQSAQSERAPTDPLTLQQASQGAASTYARLLTDRTVLEELNPEIFNGSIGVDGLQARTGAKAIPDTSLIEVSATGNDLTDARSLASQLVTGFIALTQSSTSNRSQLVQKQLEQRIAQLTDQIQALSARSPRRSEQLVSLRAARAALNARLAAEVASGIEQSSRITLIAPPAGSDTPIRPRTLLNLIGGVLVGFLLGIGLVLLRARLDTLVRGAREVGEALRTPVLASIPQVGKPEQSAAVAESYEVARTNLAFLAAGELLRVITVTSYTAGEGKSTSAMALARAEARSGKRVLVVDGDMRTRALSTRFGCAGKPGLSLLLSHTAPAANVEVELEQNLFLLPAGSPPPDPVHLLAGSRMRSLLQELREDYDLILLDAPPVVHLADAPILASLADGIVVVARAGYTKQSHLTDLDTQLRNIPRRLLGAIVIEQRTFAHEYPLAKVRPLENARADAREARAPAQYSVGAGRKP